MTDKRLNSCSFAGMWAKSAVSHFAQQHLQYLITWCHSQCVSWLHMDGDNTMNTGGASICSAVPLRSLCCLRTASSFHGDWPSGAGAAAPGSAGPTSAVTAFLFTKGTKTQEATSVCVRGRLMILWYVTTTLGRLLLWQTEAKSRRYCKNSHVMRGFSCESHLLTFHSVLCRKKKKTLFIGTQTLFWRVTATSCHSKNKRKHLQAFVAWD